MPVQPGNIMNPAQECGIGSMYLPKIPLSIDPFLQGGEDKSLKWETLEHSGVLFPPDYTPHGVKMLYDGMPVDLTPEQEEVRPSLRPWHAFDGVSPMQLKCYARLASLAV